MSLFYLHLSDKVIFLTFSLPCYQFPLEVRGDPERCDHIRQNTSSCLFWPTHSIFTKGNWNGSHSLLAYGKTNNSEPHIKQDCAWMAVIQEVSLFVLLGGIHFVPIYHHFDVRKKRGVHLTLSPGSPCLPGGPGSPSAPSP